MVVFFGSFDVLFEKGGIDGSAKHKYVQEEEFSIDNYSYVSFGGYRCSSADAAVLYSVSVLTLPSAEIQFPFVRFLYCTSSFFSSP